jgi:hypothetical protein
MDGSHWPKWLVDWIERDSKNWAAVPRIRYGYVAGPSVRFEQAGARAEYQSSALANRLIKNIGAVDIGIEADYGITHLQKQSHFGFIIAEPFCFYVWWQIRPQSTKLSDGSVLTTIPGSELCPTFRVGKGRWDALDHKYIKPTLQAGLHWD